MPSQYLPPSGTLQESSDRHLLNYMLCTTPTVWKLDSFCCKNQHIFICKLDPQPQTLLKPRNQLCCYRLSSWQGVHVDFSKLPQQGLCSRRGEGHCSAHHLEKVLFTQHVMSCILCMSVYSQRTKPLNVSGLRADVCVGLSDHKGFSQVA